MSTAVFGGAFDPPHNGHVELVRRALDHFGFDRLLVVTADRPPHKTVTTPGRIRARLAELAFAEIPRVEMSKVELGRRGSRYTIDTLKRLGKRHDDLTLLVGADQFAGFMSWRDPNGILEIARLAVANRPGRDEAEFLPILTALEHPERVALFSISPHPISSREIRARVEQGLPIYDLVPEPVAAEIERLGLYRG
jgi:nicotinate-nucleotide adenylyltransferase